MKLLLGLLLILVQVGLHIRPSDAVLVDQMNAIQNENCTRFLHLSEDGNYSLYSTRNSMCPPWYSQNSTDGRECYPRMRLKGIVMYGERTNQTSLQTFYCMTTSFQNGTNRTDVIGGCLLSFNVRNQSAYYPLPCNISKLNKYMCAGLNREGQLCGRCVKGFVPPIFSYSLSCFNCTNYHLKWLKYISLAFGPLTVFCILICVFHISATSAYLFGFVFYSQILTMPTILRMAESSVGYQQESLNLRIVYRFYISLLSVWNLDIFRAFYPSLCLHPDMRVVQALALDYLIALYPLVLLAIVKLLVSLHNYRNVKVLVKLWKPFRSILWPLIRNLNIETSLIQSFATLFFLSAMKVQSVTLDLLSPTALYHIDGRLDDKYYLYLAGDVEYFGKEHLPYALMALFFLLMFTVFPCLLLFLYPCQFFQRFLNNIHCNSHALRTFMDVFQGNFKDGTNSTRDYRYFAGVFFVTRLILTAIFILFSSIYSILLFGTVITMLGFSVAIFHPQRTKIHYTLDCIILLLLSVFFFSVIGYFMSPNGSIVRKISSNFGLLSLLLPLMYITCLSVYWVVVRKRIPQRFGYFVMRSATKLFHCKRSQQQHLLVCAD